MQVLLLDDDDDLREGMKWMFETVDLPMQGFARFDVFKENLDSYVNSNAELCLLLDLRMPDMSGLEVFEWLKRSGYSLERLPVIFLTGHGDISTAVEAVKNGAFDFYEKPTTDQRLVERVKQALQKSGEFLANLEVLWPLNLCKGECDMKAEKFGSRRANYLYRELSQTAQLEPHLYLARQAAKR